MRNARLDEAEAGIMIARRNINNFRYADDTTLMAESKEELKSLLMKVKEDSEKSWLKTQHAKKMKIMASCCITSWQIDGETMETVQDFIFLGSKITAVCDCSPEIEKHLLLGRKTMTNLDSVLKSRNITLPTKFKNKKNCKKIKLKKKSLSSQSYDFFNSHLWVCETWTIKKAEC